MAVPAAPRSEANSVPVAGPAGVQASVIECAASATTVIAMPGASTIWRR